MKKIKAVLIRFFTRTIAASTFSITMQFALLDSQTRGSSVYVHLVTRRNIVIDAQGEVERDFTPAKKLPSPSLEPRDEWRER